MLPNEIFLSHSNHNEKFISKLADILDHHKISVWYCQKNILGAQQWHDEIGRALNRCDWFAVILSCESVKSMWVKRELIFALQQKHYEDRIIPLLYQDCDYEKLSWVLSSFQIIDFRNNFNDGCLDLLRIWQ